MKIALLLVLLLISMKDYWLNERCIMLSLLLSITLYFMILLLAYNLKSNICTMTFILLIYIKYLYLFLCYIYFSVPKRKEKSALMANVIIQYNQSTIYWKHIYTMLTLLLTVQNCAWWYKIYKQVIWYCF